jgi:hypothetical protein
VHSIPDVLGLAGYELSLLALDVVLLLTVIRDDQLVHVLDELLHHAGLQCLEPV